MSEVKKQWVEFKDLAHALGGTEDETSRLQYAMNSVQVLIPGCDHAGMTLNGEGGMVTRVSSDDVSRRADEIQYEVGEGPCLNLRRDNDTLVSNDLTQEPRWPYWADRVHDELGVSAVMASLVYTDKDFYGAMSLYADEGRRFDTDDVAIAKGLAEYLAGIIASGREIDHPGMAIRNRAVIDKAEGILMERLHIPRPRPSNT